MTFEFTSNWSGQTTGHYQTFFHIGQDGRGIILAANGSTALIFAQPASTGMYDGAYELKNHPFQQGDNTVVFTLKATETAGTFSSSITLNGTEYAMRDMSWTTMNWSTDAAQRNKYSVGETAPGWDSNKLETVTLGDGGIVMTHTYSVPVVPEPATGTLSLLALAGLCARRRRK